MSYTAYDIKEFYKTKTGKYAKRQLLAMVQKTWRRRLTGNFFGVGFPIPFIKHLDGEKLREFVVLPSELGAFWWQSKPDKGNCVGLCSQSELPFDDEVADSILSIHALEFSRDPDDAIAEIWRILKPQGRLLIVVSNRSGLWARRDTTPFGHGRPYSSTQLVKLLKDHNFVIEQARHTLYTPPFKSEFMLKAFSFLEYLGIGGMMPFFAGVHVIEASKQIHAIPKKMSAREQLLLRRKIRFNVSPEPQPG